jgi:transcriptional regulator with XRE-family HTH domain
MDRVSKLLADALDADMRAANGGRGMTQSALSKLSGVGQTNVSRLLRGAVTPNTATISRLVAVFPDGHFSRAVTSVIPVGHGGALQVFDLDAHPGVLRIKCIAMPAQAGCDGFALPLCEEEGPPVYLPMEFARVNGYRADKLVAIHVRGRSMEPSLYDGDIVAINMADAEPKDDVVFVVGYEGQVSIKRLRRDAGQWFLYSDNVDQRRYSPKLCTEDVCIYGRVIFRQTEVV